MGAGEGWLKPVTVKTEMSPEKNKIYGGYIITKDKLNGSHNAVVNAVLSSGKFHLLNGVLVTGGPTKLSLTPSDEPIVVVDGAQIYIPSGTDVEMSSPVVAYLSSVASEGIEYIRLLNESESGMYGLRGSRGVIEIVSSNSNSTNIFNKGLALIHPQGYHVPKPFVMPDYTDKKGKNSKTADDRLSIFWDANVVTDNNGKATINFFTADAPATYTVNISGVTAKGDNFFKTYTIKRR
jgi:hypothetical protein